MRKCAGCAATDTNEDAHYPDSTRFCPKCGQPTVAMSRRWVVASFVLMLITYALIAALLVVGLRQGEAAPADGAMWRGIQARGK